MDRMQSATSTDRAAIEAFIAGAGARDAAAALTEYKMRAMAGEVPGRGFVGFAGEDLVGYVQAAWHPPVTGEGRGHWAFEVVVHPGEIGDAPRLLSRAGADFPGEAALLVWVWDAALDALLEAAGFREVRRIERMSVDLPVAIDAPLPDGIRLAPFRVHRDESAWIATNNRAFAGHPENGAVTSEEMRGRMALSWFSAGDLLMAWQEDQLAGSCWTKVHPRGVGEIYIIGVDPAVEGSGLGKALLVAGAHHLHRERNCSRLMLFTDTANARAQRLYASVGFVTDLVNRQLEFPDRTAVPAVGSG
jgi:mycothiol synthase